MLKKAIRLKNKKNGRRVCGATLFIAISLNYKKIVFNLFAFSFLTMESNGKTINYVIELFRRFPKAQLYHSFYAESVIYVVVKYPLSIVVILFTRYYIIFFYHIDHRWFKEN